MVDTSMMQTYSLLTAQAIAPIILGSFKSLKTPASVTARRKAAKRKITSLLDEDDEDDDEPLDETLTWADTLLFPVVGSIALLGFYLVLKYVGKEWINLLLGIYFSGAGMFAIQSTLSTLVTFAMRTAGAEPAKYHIRISSSLRQVWHATFTIPSLLLLPISIGAPACYIPLGRPYLISNLIALCLSTATLQLLRLDSFLTAGVLLGVLLVYDIFWVFATPVMVTVAKGLDAPIKLLAPRPSASGLDFAMLGLGDVVVPGLMVALCLRFDLAQHAARHPGTDVGPRSSFRRPYFWVGVMSYLAGLGVTMGVMTWSGRAQPALLYLSPACILGPLLLGAIRGELKQMWAYNESAEEGSAKRDETIEPGSEAAQAARAKMRAAGEVKAGSGSGSGSAGQANGEDAPAGAGEESGVEGGVGTDGKDGAEEDESWMNGSGVAGGDQDGKARRRKGRKK